MAMSGVILKDKFGIMDVSTILKYFNKSIDNEQLELECVVDQKIITKYRRGFKKREWVLMRPRNEALDCRVYAVSAFILLNADLNTIAQRQKKVQTDNPNKVNPNRLKHYTKNSNFVRRWNN